MIAYKQYKCIGCDRHFAVEVFEGDAINKMFTCPNCQSRILVKRTMLDNHKVEVLKAKAGKPTKIKYMGNEYALQHKNQYSGGKNNG